MTDFQAIQTYLQANLLEYFALHRRMVEINSFTANPQGVNALGELTASQFAELGFEAEFAQSTDARYGRHLFLHRPGNLPADASVPLALVSHLDTVFPAEEERLNNFQWSREGERIYGPGTVDIKGGTVIIYMLLDALRQFDPQVFEATDWRVCLNATEEVLSDEFSQLCLERLPASTRACLVFEGGTPTEGAFSVVVARKGRATYRLSTEGRSAHAGNYHHLGANAVVQMAHSIQKIARLTDYQQQITFNVGTVSGGVVVNRVPHFAEAEVEMRAFSLEVFEAGIASMLALDGSSEISSQDGYPCRLRVRLEERTAPWPRNPGTQSLYQIWEGAASQLGMRIVPEERGGLSDGNLLWQAFPTLDGLGPDGANAHCSERSPDGRKEQEYARADSFVPKAMLNLAAIMDLLRAA
jgi:glutamate carboxypeptidase